MKLSSIALFTLMLCSGCPETIPNPHADAGPGLDAMVSHDAGAPDAARCGAGCGGTMPVCDVASQRCVECGASTDCHDAASPVCDLTMHACVGCMHDTDCHDAREPHCDMTHEVCVECVTSTQCTATTAPACDPATNVCVECLAETDCAGRTDGRTQCDTTQHRCQTCLTTAQCPTPAAARCDTTMGECAGCTADADCTHLGAGHMACAAGACVECTASNRTACGANVCDGSTHTCTTFAAGSAELCRPCVADAQCMPGQLCVPTMFGTPAVAVGNFCLRKRLDLTSHDCVSFPPYVQSLGATSLDGVAADICTFHETTCTAYVDFNSRPCSSPDAFDPACGAPGLDDGVCTMAGPTSNICSIPCAGDLDCPGTGCNMRSPRYCNL